MERARSVHEKLVKQKKKLAIAESCTGGLLMATLTQFAGASDYLVGGVLAYSNEVKRSILNVSPETLNKYGAVSSETVLEMVQGLFNTTKAEIAIAVSGIFGPSGGTKEKPVGTVWIAIGERGGKLESRQIPLDQNLSREIYREKVVAYLLEALWSL